MALLGPGEAELKVGENTYRIVLKTAGLAALQKHFSVPGKVADLDDLLSKVNAGSVEHIVVFIWAALLKHHPEFTIETTTDLIDDAGGVMGLAMQLLDVGQGVVPDPVDVKELSEGVKKNPRKARARTPAGTGENSNSRLGASA